MADLGRLSREMTGSPITIEKVRPQFLPCESLLVSCEVTRWTHKTRRVCCDDANIFIGCRVCLSVKPRGTDTRVS